MCYLSSVGLVIDEMFRANQIVLSPMAVVLFQLVFIFEKRAAFKNGTFAVDVDFPAMTRVGDAGWLARVAPA